jgi:hypothetical protein
LNRDPDTFKPIRNDQRTRDYDKVFGIGYFKTGTTTLERVLQDLGFRMPEQRQQEIALTESVCRGDFAPFLSYVPQYEAFQDAPFAQGDTYIACDTFFPDSRFILTVREAESWFASLCRFHRKIWKIKDLSKLQETDIKRIFYLFDGYIYAQTQRLLTVVEDGRTSVRWDLLYDHDYYIAQYLKRNEDVRSYFRHRPKHFLEIDLTREADTSRVCAFLGFSDECVTTMPHENRSLPAV